MAEYRIVDRYGSHTEKKTSPFSVAAYMLGRHVHNYIIIKSDEKGDRIFNVKNWDGNCETIADDLERL